jgi:hypothetical protein
LEQDSRNFGGLFKARIGAETITVYVKKGTQDRYLGKAGEVEDTWDGSSFRVVSTVIG